VKQQCDNSVTTTCYLQEMVLGHALVVPARHQHGLAVLGVEGEHIAADGGAGAAGVVGEGGAGALALGRHPGVLRQTLCVCVCVCVSV
jgi:hypothetical protein